ncbi:aminotransferase class I/II-fold pyridoxal phosphate-dependent enzyme [Tannockella kyphosi]|uniref:aminotransferase class I/II-fold pyridoxal phosphate-dependent enzyme n=1 Tax=Tannockella kyphosi TaxID=2899121 RepID=UPI00201337B5|nr:aminotransferase class I/II-fold pyridoxal phosphate-dependent enzyme [Tannockella kyphosi]
MKLDVFEVEMWMTEHENNCLYNLADSCVPSLSIQDLLEYCDNKDEIIRNLMETKLDYGPIIGSKEVREGILNLYKTGNIDQITICHGCTSAIELVIQTVLQPGDHMITVTPTYQIFYSYPESFGIEVDKIELKQENDWIPTIDDFESLIKENTKMIALVSPNNPTGKCLDNELLQEIVLLCKKHQLYFMIDEVYRGISYDYEMAVSDLYELGISVSSLSKCLGFAGLRLGWVKSNEQLIGLINERRDYTLISSGYLYDYLASIALKHYSAIIAKQIDRVHNNRVLLKEWLQQEDLLSGVVPEVGTMMFLKYHIPMDSKLLCTTLQEETGVFFVPGGCFGVENHLRFGIAGDWQEIHAGLEIFSKWLHQKAD